MTDRVFRIRTAVDLSSNGSMGKVELTSDPKRVMEALLDAYLDVISFERTTSVRKPLATKWRMHRKIEQNPTKPVLAYPRVSRIIAVDQFIDNAWVEIKPEFVDPDVVLIGVQ